MPDAHQFDPEKHPGDPARDLTLLIRGLRLGDQVLLANGTTVKSIAVRHGAHMHRRFAVVRRHADPIHRHQAVVLGKESYKTASQAAMGALGKIGER